MSTRDQTRARSHAEHAIPLSRSDAECWVKKLSGSDPQRAAVEVKSVLAVMTDNDIPPRRRLEVMEALRETVSTIDYRLADQGAGLRLPQSSSMQKETTLLTKIHHLLALNYSWAAISFASTGTRYDISSHAMAIHRAMLYFSAVCCDAYRVYQPVPSGVWLAMHELIVKAQEHQLLKFPVTDKLNAFKPQTTITHVYKQMLLTAALDPYKLPKGEIDTMHDRCNKWAVHALLVAPPFVPSGKCQFLIDLSEDGPGRVVRRRDTLDESEQYLVLDTTQLVVGLYEQFQDVELRLKKAPVNDRDPDVVERYRMLNDLIMAWGGRLRRRSMRLTATDKRKVMSGFEGVSCMLNGGEKFMSAERANADVIHNNSRDGQLQRQHGPIDLGEWTCVDESSSGVQLKTEISSPTANLIGQLIAVQRPSSREIVWDVGVVRWMRNDIVNQIAIGVYKLGPRARPALIEDVATRSRRGDQRSAILALLIDHAKNGACQSFVAQKDRVSSRHQYVVSDGGRSFLIQPTQMKLATDAVEWYEYEIVQEITNGACEGGAGMRCLGAA